MQTTGLMASLFGKSDHKSAKKTQTVPYNVKLDALNHKSNLPHNNQNIGNKVPMQIEKPDQGKANKNKTDENAVAKVLNNVKGSKPKRQPNFEGGPKLQLQKPQKIVEVAEPIDIELPVFNPEVIYDRTYGEEMEKNLYSNMPSFALCLKNTSISDKMRAKMVDWIIEVLSNYNQSTSHQTLFLAVAIMDMYCKNSKKILQDGDVHLIGICSMYLASKYDDIYHIPLKDIIKKVSHGKFTSEQIKEKEWEIVATLDFNINFPTYMDILGRIIYKNFQEDDSNNLKSIRETSIYILKMCIHDYEMLRFSPKIICYSALCYSIKCLFNNILDNVQRQNLTYHEIQSQEAVLLKAILSSGVSNEINEIQTCMESIKELTLQFKKKYPDLQNLERFSDSIKN